MAALSLLDPDPRWRRLLDDAWECPACDVVHHGLADLGCDRPDYFPEGEPKQPNAAVRTSTRFLSEDFCILEGNHFVRCVLELPLIGSGGRTFGYGVWSTLSAKNFALYVDTFDAGEQGGLGPWFGWFSNRLKGYPETLNLKCQLHPVAGRQRPRIELEPTGHPLALEQREGITVDRLLEIYAVNGHDIRRARLD